MAEQVERCHEKNELKCEHDSTKTRAGSVESNDNTSGSESKPFDAIGSTATVGVASDHAEDLLQTNRSVLSLYEDNVEGKTLNRNEGKVEPDEGTKTNNVGGNSPADGFIHSKDSGTEAKVKCHTTEDEKNDTKDGMNSQHHPLMTIEKKRSNQEDKSIGLGNSRLHHAQNQLKVDEKTPGSQASRMAESDDQKCNENSRKEELLPAKNKQSSSKEASDTSMINTESESCGNIGKNVLKQEKTAKSRSDFCKKIIAESMEQGKNSEEELLNKNGGTSPTFDKFEGVNGNEKGMTLSQNPLKSHGCVDKNKEVDLCSKSSALTESDESALASTLEHAHKSSSNMGKSNDAIKKAAEKYPEKKNVDAEKDLVHLLSTDNEGHKEENKELNAKDKKKPDVEDKGSIDEESNVKTSTKKITKSSDKNDFLGKSTDSSNEGIGVADNSKEKTAEEEGIKVKKSTGKGMKASDKEDLMEPSKTDLSNAEIDKVDNVICEVNGEDSCQKSDCSIEESEKSSDSDPAFTKRASNDPNFATVYSFLSLFGHLLNLPEFSIDDFEQGLENCNDLSLKTEKHGLLETLHLKLLRRLSRSCRTQFSSLGQVSNDRLIKYLIKFSKCVDLDLAWDLEKFGYHVLGSTERLVLLKALCEIHFDENPRFKIHFTDEFIKTDNFEALRLQPEGHDIQGKAIWYQQDKFACFRVYSVEEDDEFGNSWKLLASTLEELDHLVESFKTKTEINPKDVALSKRKERKEKILALEQANKNSKKRKGKARRTRKSKALSESESDEEDENPCAHCFSNKRPDMVLLCDKCDAAYHTLCLRPPLLTIPEGDWICSYCQQLELIETLQAKYKVLSTRKKALERISKRTVFDDIKVSNIVEGDDDSRRSGRQRSKIDYNFTNYNQLINDAISNESRSSNQSSSRVSASNFYSQSSGHRKSRRLNDLEGDSFGSESSEYENSDGENTANVPKIREASASLGCRRSRRLKRKYGDEEQWESSESEEENFVRRSTRKRKSAKRTYMEYESDDTPEEVITPKKSTRLDDSDEYVVSGSEEDPEEVLLPRRSRKILSEEEDADETPDCDDEETDVDEEICEDFERNVVSDEEEEEEQVNLSLSEEDEAGGNEEAYTTGDDDGNDSDSRKKRVKESQGNKRGGKDIRNIIKSMREEKVPAKSSADKEEELNSKNAAQDSGIGKEDNVSSLLKEAVNVKVEEETVSSGVTKEDSGKEVLELEEDEKTTGEVSCESGAVRKEDEYKRDEVDEVDVEPEGAMKEPSDAKARVSLTTRHDNLESNPEREVGRPSGEVKRTQVEKISRRNVGEPGFPVSAILKRKESQKDLELFDRRGVSSVPSNKHTSKEEDEKRRASKVKLEAMARDAPRFPRSPVAKVSHDPSKATIALSTFTPTLKYPMVQPPYHQGPSSVMRMQHQQEVLRPRPYTVEAMRPYESYPQSNNASYPPGHNPYLMRPPYENLLDQPPVYQQNMHGYQRIAPPPQYPGYAGNEQQAMWRSQRYPSSMQWSYPSYHGMSPQGEPHQQAQMHRPYLHMQSYEEKAPGGSAVTKSHSNANSSHGVAETTRRSKTQPSPVDSRKPSASESYAAFRNMVIGTTDGSSSKKAKRS